MAARYGEELKKFAKGYQVLVTPDGEECISLVKPAEAVARYLASILHGTKDATCRITTSWNNGGYRNGCVPKPMRELIADELRPFLPTHFTGQLVLHLHQGGLSGTQIINK